MTTRHAITMLALHPTTTRDLQARTELAQALPGVQVGVPDQEGVFDILLDAESRDDALHRVWNAVAASGTDDHIAFLEHPDLPEHWRRRSRPPRGR
jgi:hypothetical protein